MDMDNNVVLMIQTSRMQNHAVAVFHRTEKRHTGRRNIQHAHAIQVYKSKKVIVSATGTGTGIARATQPQPATNSH
jgi:hypothetical protein